MDNIENKQEDLFADPQATPTSAPAPVVSEVPQELADLVGEGKKYKDVSAALLSVRPAQEHIAQLEQELAQVRGELATAKNELAARGSVADALSAIKPTTPTPAGGEVDVAATVKQILEAERRQALATSNKAAVAKSLKDRFGDKAPELFAAKGRELGINLTDLAAQSPAAVLAYFPDTVVPHQPSLKPGGVPQQPSAAGKSFKEITAELQQKFANL